MNILCPCNRNRENARIEKRELDLRTEEGTSDDSCRKFYLVWITDFAPL